uniref:Late embryogenesis abundant protein LEA-2 subgroup domain-containing protein n=1 Tax=Aegilops tauschii subsp. strangulata TaxID=200361 RepID=A0A453Q5Z1_AEGTS
MGRLPEMDDDVERQPAYGDQEIMEKKAKATRDCCASWCFAVTSCIVISLCIVVPIEYYGLDNHYSVAIDSISGLDPKRGLSFNLTLVVASRSYGFKACINPGTYIEVYYGGVQLAASVAETRGLCAAPRKSVEQQVMAMATGVPAGDVLHSLTEDMRKGVVEFDVQLHLPTGSYGGEDGVLEWASQCKGMRVGGVAPSCDSSNQEAM